MKTLIAYIKLFAPGLLRDLGIRKDNLIVRLMQLLVIILIMAYVFIRLMCTPENKW